MSDYRPTFKRSAASRPLRQRLTPLAWALIGVVALVTVLGMVGGALAWANRSSGAVWNPTPTATVPPTETHALPSPTPTEWWQGTVAPTAEAEATAASPAWWAGQMTQDEEGRWWPPDEVVEMVRQQYEAGIEAETACVLGATSPGLDAYVQTLPLYLDGPRLRFYQDTYIPGVRSGDLDLVVAEWEGCLLQVQDFSEEGLECSLGRTCRNGTRYFYNFVTGELTEEHVEQMGLDLYRMRYDPADGRWKVFRDLGHAPPPDS
jgi:hypothetical protein